MLVYTLKEQERVLVCTPEGREIVLTLVRTSDGRAKIGFDADRSIAIDREKVALQKRSAA